MLQSIGRHLIVIIAIFAVSVCAAPRARDDSQQEVNRSSRITDGARADKVDVLPGLHANDLDFDMYAGYVTVDEDAGRALFYALAESQRAPESDPLVLWLNGGPGCSSIGGGFFSELGPFYPTPGGKSLVRNKYAWNRVANVLFIESPAFVGFSYSNRTEDRVVGDWRTSQDLILFLRGFLDRFPHYKSRPFWVTGESYGGHYVPNLVEAIIDAQKQPADSNAESADINLQGFLVGNAWTDAAIDNGGAIDFWYSHAIVSGATKNGIHRYCDLASVGPLHAQLTALEAGGYTAWLRRLLGWAKMGWFHKNAQKCTAAISNVAVEMGNINIYQILADVCLPSQDAVQRLGHYLGSGSPIGAALAARSAIAGSTAALKGRYDPCIDGEVEEYVNRADVQTALHANVSGSLPGRWSDCSTVVQYNMSDLFTSMIPVYHKLLKEAPHIKIVVYSGDVDGIVPVLGSRRWIESLKLPITHAWRPWYSSSGQVGGYVERYKGLTFATVRGAGHMVPYTQPERGYHLFAKMIHGEAL